MKKTILNFLFVVSLIVLVFICSAYSVQKPLLENFHNHFQPSFEIPGLEDDFVPQGITHLEKEDIFLLCGYVHKDDQASRIYVMDHGDIRKIELYTSENKPYTGHTGGIANSNNIVWLANDGEGDENCVWTLSLDEILDQNTSVIYLKESFTLEVRASTCTAHNGYLWVGEYEDNIHYFTKDSHHLSKNNTALALAYKIDENSKNGISNTTPQMALSLRNTLQGIDFDSDDNIYLSTSCGLNNSSLDVHENVFLNEADTSILINNENIPVWILNETTLKHSITMPPMSEGITFKKNDLYILFESASNKYKFGKILGFDRMYMY